MGTNQAFSKGNAASEITFAEVEQVCQEQCERDDSPQAFVVGGVLTANSLMAVKRDFLEDGQCLTWPGLPLAGATFDPNWGFALAEVTRGDGGSARFVPPSRAIDASSSGDTWGYRLCPIDHCEITEAIAQLARIRSKLSSPLKLQNLARPSIIVAEI